MRVVLIHMRIHVCLWVLWGFLVGATRVGESREQVPFMPEIPEISFSCTTKHFLHNQAFSYIIFFTKDLKSLSDIRYMRELHQIFPGSIQEIFAHHNFNGDKKQMVSLTGVFKKKPVTVYCIGLGDDFTESHTFVKRISGGVKQAFKFIKKTSCQPVCVAVPALKKDPAGLSEVIKHAIITIYKELYTFNVLRKSKEDYQWGGDIIFSVAPMSDINTLNNSLRVGDITGRALYMTPYWTDMPSNIKKPSWMSDGLSKLAQDSNITCKIVHTDEARTLGMGCFLAVNQGACDDGSLVVLEYEPKSMSDETKTIVLVGKGVTFDSGGMNVKSFENMVGMYTGMAGAAAVASVVWAVAQTQSQVHVVGVMPFVENMIGNMACKSGDIITSMNGKTIEIISTDAEGRLILADALWYAEKFYKPDVMIDIATLTSGTRIALGPVYSSLMSHDEQLAQKLMALGEKCGDRVWRMPLDNRYAKALKSKRADLMNQAPKDFGASSIMGAQFLSSFVVCPHWAHLDIAGTVRKTHQAGKSATGAGVRLLIEYISPCNELYS